VWLQVNDAVSIANLKVETANELSDAKRVTVKGFLANPTQAAFAGTALVELCAVDGAVLHQQAVDVAGAEFSASFESLAGLALWELDSPALYVARVTLNTSAGSDQHSTRFGFRTARFTTEGFFLNGKPLKIRGLNRHQSYPYVGYAMGQRAQAKDADVMKDVLKCNLVRTSHYPQSTYFLDRCDEIGLLVFEEIPGWQHMRWPGSAGRVGGERAPHGRARLEPPLHHHLGRAHQRVAGQPRLLHPHQRDGPQPGHHPPDRWRALHRKQRAAGRRVHRERLLPRGPPEWTEGHCPHPAAPAPLR